MQPVLETKSRTEVARTARTLKDRNDSKPSLPSVLPDYAAAVVVRAKDGTCEMREMRWGLPSSKKALFEAATKRAGK